ncbi:MAG: DUF885 domain-containing protein [Terriglobia bacterium]
MAEGFAQLAEEFLQGYLALSPITATYLGYHQYTDPKTGVVVRLDERLDDVSPAGIDEQLAFLHTFRSRLRREVPVAGLDSQTRADYELLRDVIELNLLELERIESYRHKPQLYVEALGTAIFVPLAVEYAPREERLQHILARLEQLPAFLAAARENLVSTAPIFLRTAVEENKGNISLIQAAVKTLVPESGPLAERYPRVAAAAVAALEAFNQWLETDLGSRATDSWRLGKTLYPAKLRYALGTDLTALTILRDAQRGLVRVRGEMLRTAEPLHRQWFPDHGEHSDLSGEERENVIIREVLDRIAEDHPRPERLFAQVRQDVKDLQAFLAEKQLLTLTGRENLQVIETPPFMRGIYGVAGFWPAPPLQPELGAFYLVTPIPEDWTAEQVESKLREYNDYMLEILTIHEALPGHYIQFEHAASIEPEWRRILRGVFGNTPNVEGWATYAQDVVLQAGFRDADPRLALTNQKMLLRVLANAILDVRMHTGEMSDEEALDLMINRTFQEKAEAEGKLRRAKLSSTQLPSYFVGWREWWRLRRDFERQRGEKFSLADFHNRALAAGAVNLRSLRRLLLR